MPFQIVRQDITKMEVDAIVNAANPALRMGGGVCGAIFNAAGPDQLKKACGRIGGCTTGQAVITKGYDLPAKYIIHTVGPIWQDGKHNEPSLLHDCYTNSLRLALQHKCASIAFPLISSGIYGYPKDQALKVATMAITEFLLEHDMDVHLVVFNRKALSISEKLFAGVKQYVDDNYVEETKNRFSADRKIHVQDYQEILHSPSESSESIWKQAKAKDKRATTRSLEDMLKQMGESFTQMLVRLIDEKGLTYVETYKRANIDRRLFSKIRSGKGYNPSKCTAVALAIALHLNLDQTLDLLGKAGYTLARNNKFDLIIEYFITEELYNIYEINEVLFAYRQTLLGT